MINKFLLFLVIILGFELSVFPQRNSFKLIGYTYNNNFAKPILLNNYNYDFNNINHSLTFGYERTFGKNLALCVNYYLPLGFNASQVNVSSTSNYYVVDQKVTGWGAGYNARYYIHGLNNGCPNGKYLEVGYTRYKYSNMMTIQPSTSGPSNSAYLGQLNHVLVINKIGIKYGIERVSSNILFDIFAAVDYNFWNTSFDKIHFNEFNKTDYQQSFSISFGLLVGVNL